MKRTASTLNLAEHLVQAKSDIGPTVAYCSSEIKGFKVPLPTNKQTNKQIFTGLSPSCEQSKSDEYFVKDFWRGMPSELPEETPHLPR